MDVESDVMEDFMVLTHHPVKVTKLNRLRQCGHGAHIRVPENFLL